MVGIIVKTGRDKYKFIGSEKLFINGNTPAGESADFCQQHLP